MYLVNYIVTAGALIASREQVRTLFVSGLPMDAKPRELHLLFQAYKVSFVSGKEVMLYRGLFVCFMFVDDGYLFVILLPRS